MISFCLVIMRDMILQSISQLINNLGNGSMPGVIYDTAVIGAIKNNVGYSLFPVQVKRVLSLQHSDGSWGADRYQPYDRLLSTAAVAYMIVELELNKNLKYSVQFERGVNWITENQEKVLKSRYPLPVAFEFIYIWLLNTIMQKTNSLNVSISRLEKAKEKKLSFIGDQIYSMYNPLFFSMEALVKNKLQAEQLSSFQSKNGSLCASPASTSIFIKHRVKSAIPGAMKYLKKESLKKNGMFQHFGDYTYFNIAYSLYPLLKTNYTFGREVISPSSKLISNWNKEGISFGYSFPILDADDTSVALVVLKKLGVDVSDKIKSIWAYEDEKFFKTYFIENDPALLTNVHILEAFLDIPTEGSELAIKKIKLYLDGLGSDVVLNTKFVSSKIMQLGNIVVSLLPTLVNYAKNYLFVLEDEIRNMLNNNYFLHTEELSLSLFGLTKAAMHGLAIDENMVHKVYNLLMERLDSNLNYQHSFFWTSKVQYAPIEVDRAYLLSGLLNYINLFKKN